MIRLRSIRWHPSTPAESRRSLGDWLTARGAWVVIQGDRWLIRWGGMQAIERSVG